MIRVRVRARVRVGVRVRPTHGHGHESPTHGMVMIRLHVHMAWPMLPAHDSRHHWSWQRSLHTRGWGLMPCVHIGKS